MRDVTTELKELRLHGMAVAWTDLMEQGTTATESSRWLIEHLLQAELTDRAMRSVSHQMTCGQVPGASRSGRLRLRRRPRSITP